MNKIAFLLPLLFLGACARLTGDAYNEDEFVTEESGIVFEQPEIAPENPDKGVQSAKPAYTQPVIQNATISADGTVINLPAQQIYLGNGTTESPIPVQQKAAGWPTLSYSEPMEMRQQPLPPPMPKGSDVVTLQNRAYPNTFAQCAAMDTGCIMSYEQQGYVRLNGTPQFAGYQDVLTHSDYPQNGQWRNGNNIPRW